MRGGPAGPERALLDDLRAIVRGSERTYVVLGGLVLGFLAFSFVGTIALDSGQRGPLTAYGYLSGPDAVGYLVPEAITVVAVCVGVFLARASGDRLSDLEDRSTPGTGPPSAEARATSFLDRSGRWSTELGRIETLTIVGAALLSVVFVAVVWTEPFLPPGSGAGSVALLYFEFLGLPLGVASYALIEVIDAWRAGSRWSRRLVDERREVGAGGLGPTEAARGTGGEVSARTISVFERSDSDLRAAVRSFRTAIAASAAILVGVTLGAILIAGVVSTVEGPYFAPAVVGQPATLLLDGVALGVGLAVLAALFVRGGGSPKAQGPPSAGHREGPWSASEALARFARASDELLRLRQLGRLTAAAIGWSLAWLVVWSVLSAPGLFRPYLVAGGWLTALAFLAVLGLGALLYRSVGAGSEVRRLERALSRMASEIGQVEHEFWERF